MSTPQVSLYARYQSDAQHMVNSLNTIIHNPSSNPTLDRKAVQMLTTYILAQYDKMCIIHNILHPNKT